MIWTTNHEFGNKLQNIWNENYDASSAESASKVSDADDAGESNKNLLNFGNLKKKSKANFIRIDFFISEAKKIFIQL